MLCFGAQPKQDSIKGNKHYKAQALFHYDFPLWWSTQKGQ